MADPDDGPWDVPTDPELPLPTDPDDASRATGGGRMVAGGENVCLRLSPSELAVLRRRSLETGATRQELIRRWIRRGCP